MALSNGVLSILFLLSIGIAAYGLKRKRFNLPPGPKGLPIVGMAFENAKGFQWLSYEKWGKEYGSDVIYIHMFGKPVIVLNSMQAANDLFEKRSSIYSDSVGWGWNLAFMEYGDKWRDHRRMFHQYFQPSVVPNYRPKIALETRKFIGRLHNSPEDWLRHVRHLTGAIIIGVTYGLDVKQENDPNVLLAEKAIFSMAATGVAGTYLVDWLPKLKHLPTWLPGTEFITQAKEWKPFVETMSVVPFKDVKKQISAGKAKSSVVASLLSGLDDSKDNAARETMIQNTAGTAYTGNSTSLTVSALGTFILAMLQNPEVQKKAQAELDRVVGNHRLVDYEDQASLPYFSAMMKEVLRWRPVTPLAASHKVMEDDEYKGYHIPGGAIVIGNSWAILHDEKIYPNPEKFDPSRFLTADGTELRKDIMEPEVAAFGFGRRKCPGRYLAMDSLWIAMAYLMQCYNIEKPVDKYGDAIEPSGQYTTGLLSYPLPFKVDFKPRSPEAVHLLNHLSMDE
ncbi:hypothetical protein PHLGIDRAFT_25626 [Phlebiopsis gigantea 11061_1 CR5-6]|uniref:Cytochrome P450 n=1 Tax=Phlebiopsis gigantea (strain 11061_1 CR5-6) TaxID=745531 RepID=A0A0C3RU29_PHLG1|nr:hypothetical protein PHLGIDRAFT_25626 [Phlebiopsis gigantea 11061_1 CR5-6]